MDPRLSRSLNVIGTEITHRYLLVPTKGCVVTINLSCIASKTYLSKTAHFSKPTFRGNSIWNCVTARELKKQNDGATWAIKKSADVLSRLDTIYECDGQTDGTPPTAGAAITHSVAR